jgi:hypothetical protein
MGQAFKVIRKKKLYKQKKFKSFEEYTEKVWGMKPWQLRHKIRASDCALIVLRDNGENSPFLPESCWGMLARLDEGELQDALAEIQTEMTNGEASVEATKKVVKRKQRVKKSKTGFIVRCIKCARKRSWCLQ